MEELRIGCFQGGYSRSLKVSRRVLPERRRAQQVVLVIGLALGMSVTVNQGFPELRPLRMVSGGVGVLVMRKGMRSQPEQPRRRTKGEDEKDGGEVLAQRHGWIVAQMGQTRGGSQEGAPQYFETEREERSSAHRQIRPLQLFEQHWLLLVQAAPFALQLPPLPGFR